MPLPERIKAEKINRRHSIVKLYADAWYDYELMVEAGEGLRQQASRFLIQRPKEHGDVYAYRAKRFTYEGHAGTGVGFYKSALFSRLPSVDIKGEEGETDASTTLTRIVSGANQRRDRSYWDMLQQWFADLVTFGRYVYLIDKTSVVPQSLADGKSRLFDPYFVRWSPRDLVNWTRDEDGSLNTVILRDDPAPRDLFSEEDGSVIKRWLVFTKDEFASYVQRKDATGKEESDAVIERSGSHVFTAIKKNPVSMVEAPSDLWLLNRASLSTREHVEQDNAIGHMTHTANLAVPIVFTDGEFEQTLSQTAYIKLRQNDRFEYAEPGGSSLDGSLRRLSEKREEIFRQMHMMAQGRSSTAQASAQSGFSKEMDMAPSQNILEGYGKILSGESIAALTAALRARGITAEVSLTGFSFVKDDASEASTSVGDAQRFGVESDTYHLELQKRLVRSSLANASEDTLARIDAELEAGEGFSAKRKREEEERQSAMSAAFQVDA